LFKINPSAVMATSIKPSRDKKAIMVRLFNASGRQEIVRLKWGTLKPSTVYFSNPYEEQGSEADFSFKMPAYAIRTLRLEK
ncbi:unnamed protein product, partial [marine sediment metagenome]